MHRLRVPLLSLVCAHAFFACGGSTAGRLHGEQVLDAGITPDRSPGSSPADAAAPLAAAADATPGAIDAPSTDGAAHDSAPVEQTLFDGTSVAAWRMAGLGGFDLTAGTLVSRPGDGLGLFWCTIPTPSDFVLTLEWKRSLEGDNSGIFVRFPNPDGKGYENTAWVGVHFGFEVQIDELGQPDGADLHKTAAIYSEQAQMAPRKPAKPVGEWNTYEIRVIGTSYAVTLNGELVTTWSYTGEPDPAHLGRGLPSTASEPRFIGLQSHSGQVAFRNIKLRSL